MSQKVYRLTFDILMFSKLNKCVSLICTVASNLNERNKSESSLHDPEDKLDITMQPRGPISVVTLGDSGSPGMVALSDEVQPPDLSASISK